MTLATTRSSVSDGNTANPSSQSRGRLLVDCSRYRYHFLAGQKERRRIRKIGAPVHGSTGCRTRLRHYHLRGWLGQIAAARKPKDEVTAYTRLQRLLREYQLREVLPYDDGAAAAFSSMQRQRIRIGTMDLRIGAIALTHERAIGVPQPSRL